MRRSIGMRLFARSGGYAHRDVLLDSLSRRPARMAFIFATVALFAAAASFPALATSPRSRQTSLPGPLYGLDAIAADDIWAVGTRPDPNDPDEDIGLAEHWDGATWTEFPTPAFGGEIGGTLLDVSGSSADGVWAVGSSGQAFFNDTQIVVEHWNGAAWSQADAPDASFNDALFGVVAVSSTDAWAVGGFDTGGTGLNHMLIEHWDGQHWTIVPTPDFPNTSLTAVDAVSANDIWAVGPSGTAMHFNGIRWSKVTTPDPGHQVEDVNDVAAVSPNDVWAVGTKSGGHPFDGLTFTEHWDGAHWSVVRSPSPSSGDEVNSVSGVPGGAVWMVGVFFPDAFTNKPLTERFVNDKWSVVAAPAKSNLDGVAALASDDVWAVGSSIYHFDGTAWQVVVPGST
jgi:hypothetical protein